MCEQTCTSDWVCANFAKHTHPTYLNCHYTLCKWQTVTYLVLLLLFNSLELQCCTITITICRCDLLKKLFIYKKNRFMAQCCASLESLGSVWTGNLDVLDVSVSAQSRESSTSLGLARSKTCKVSARLGLKKSLDYITDFYADSLWMNLRYAIDGCLSVCMYVCNEMYCDETTNVTNILFGKDIPLDNRNRSAKRRRKNPPFWPPSAILNFWWPTFENAVTFEPFEISTPDRRYIAQDWIL
jgi:hypothetical protein